MAAPSIDMICILGKILQESVECGRTIPENLERFHLIENKDDDIKSQHDYCEYVKIHGSFKFTQSRLNDYMFYSFVVARNKYNQRTYDRCKWVIQQFMDDVMTPREFWLKRVNFDWYKLIQLYVGFQLPEREKNLMKSMFNILYALYEIQLGFYITDLEYKWCDRSYTVFQRWNNAGMSIAIQYSLFNGVLYHVVTSIVNIYTQKYSVNWNEYGLGFLIANIWRKHFRHEPVLMGFRKTYENPFDLDSNNKEKIFEFSFIKFRTEEFKKGHSTSRLDAYLNMRELELQNNISNVIQYVGSQTSAAKMTGEFIGNIPVITYNSIDDSTTDD